MKTALSSAGSQIEKSKRPLSSGQGSFSWLGNRDSNPNKQSQSLSCYRYTIPQYSANEVLFRLTTRLLYIFFVKSQYLFAIFSKIYVRIQYTRNPTDRNHVTQYFSR